ncbi:MAG: hypothetical protein ACFFAU_12810 [Candidatus Hodarchaeota archaeon]
MKIDWDLIFAVAVVVHAIGHTLGVVHIFELVDLTEMPANESWLLTGQLKLDQTIVRLISTLWFVVILGFLISAGAFWFEFSWWKILTIPTVILSFAVFIVWFNSFPISTQIGAAIGNIVIIVGLLQFN